MAHDNSSNVRLEHGTADWVPRSLEDQTAVRQQLERILSDPLFAYSKRYPSILRFVVEESLQGRADHLKERTVGIEVFGRHADYDTNVDHIVRTAASEVRKRLAIYYQEEEHRSEIHIDLPLGTYAPVFRRAETLQPADREKSTTSTPVRVAAGQFPSYVIAIILLLSGVGIGFALPHVPAKVQAAESQTLVDALRPNPGQHLDIVVGDSNLKKMTSLEEYRTIRLTESQATPAGFSSDSPVNIGMLEITNALALPMVLRVVRSIPIDEVSLMHPAQLTDQAFRQDNVVLIGGPRVDPWVHLIEGKLNFLIETESGVTGFHNIAPRSGENSDYSCGQDRCYSMLAYLPNLNNTGKILLMAGPQRAATSVATNLATSNSALHDLFRLFAVRKLSDLPAFELLLDVHESGDTPIDYHVAAWRIH